MLYKYTYSKSIEERCFTYKVKADCENGFIVKFKFYVNHQDYERLLNIINVIESDRIVNFDDLIRFNFIRFRNDTLKFYNTKSSLFRQENDPSYVSLSECSFKIVGKNNISEFFVGLKESLLVNKDYYTRKIEVSKNKPSSNTDQK